MNMNVNAKLSKDQVRYKYIILKNDRISILKGWMISAIIEGI